MYYKVELRILSLKGQRNDELDYETIYYSDGYIIIIDNEIEGFLTDDYIVGEMSGKLLTLEIKSMRSIIKHPKFKANMLKETLFLGEYYFYFYGNDSTIESIFKINFVEEIVNPSKIEDINSLLKDVKGIYKIP